jgi:hypothetical protein
MCDFVKTKAGPILTITSITFLEGKTLVFKRQINKYDHFISFLAQNQQKNRHRIQMGSTNLQAFPGITLFRECDLGTEHEFGN